MSAIPSPATPPAPAAATTLPEDSASPLASELAGPAAADAKRQAGRFRQLPALAGRSFLPIGFLARLPLAMLTVGAMTLATTASGSYALGGMAAGAVGIGAAAGAPAQGHLADRRGQRSVLLAAAVAHTAAIAGLLAAVALVPDLSGPWVAVVLATALLMGLTSPQVASLARVRWMALTRHRPAVRGTALSYESTVDELTFVLGPALVGLLAAFVAAWLPFVLAAVLTIVLVPAFAVHPTHRAVPPAAGSRRPVDVPGQGPDPARWWPAAVPVLGMVSMGMFFGAAQNGVSAFGGSIGAAETAGLLYALIGVSSAVTALSVAFWPARFALVPRWILCAAGMTGCTLLLLLPQTPAQMVAALLAAGLPVGPAMVTIYGVGGLVAPAHRLGTVMTLLASGVVLGAALGAALAGAAAQAAGHTGAFLVAAAAAAVMLLVSLFALPGVRRARALPPSA
ncbi:MFS transporter [Arthrobacter sp. I2-34]|uniref:MFS transporter n=1 Tax=Arthrobacter hankyongi TaxID=2904801 RepID=A0ABS9LBJ4_9MICC|nr:MFS transporter [Arthrobacter hankyongi]MCG2624035.1 MFS transporter [Arthrobacter hankyongi]